MNEFMFEGHIDRANFGESRESEILRQFRWTDLVARLAATRDLREELSRSPEGGFDHFAALRREVDDEGKPAVNHDVLSHGKANVVRLSAAAMNAVQGDREK